MRQRLVKKQMSLALKDLAERKVKNGVLVRRGDFYVGAGNGIGKHISIEPMNWIIYVRCNGTEIEANIDGEAVKMNGVRTKLESDLHTWLFHSLGENICMTSDRLDEFWERFYAIYKQ